MNTQLSDQQIIIITTLLDLQGMLDDRISIALEKHLPLYLQQDLSRKAQEELLDVNQVAKLLHTTPQNVHAKKKAGRIPFVRFGGRVLFKKSEVIESLDSIRIRSKK